MKSSLTNPEVTDLLENLYADAFANDRTIDRAAQEAVPANAPEIEYYKAARRRYMPVSPAFGRMLYSLARTANARTIVEFGTSFGLSTIHLAAAIRDNGAGKVITTEFIPEKTEQAKKNLTVAGLVDCVEFRVGDAIAQLQANLPAEIDLVFLDGAKGLYLDVLKVLEPRLRRGAIVASDNTDHDGMEAFLHHVQTPGNGYVSSAILTESHGGTRGHEVSIRL